MSRRPMNGLPADDQAIGLLLGVPESYAPEKTKFRRQLVAIYGQETEAFLTYGLKDLLTVQVNYLSLGSVLQKATAYEDARRLFSRVLLASTMKDLLSGPPLERSYLWVISTQLILHRRIRVKTNASLILNAHCNCENVDGGRVFSGADIDMKDAKQNVEKLNKNTVYYAREMDGEETSHPVADIFFLTDRDELVLLDVTACVDDSKATSWKRKHIKTLCEAWKSDPPQNLKLLVAIVNPLDTEGVTRISSDVEGLRYIYGKEARQMLGGLVQFLAWY